VDIGANKGSYLFWLARWARQAIAFEPQPSLADYLRQATSAVGLSNVLIEEAGVSDHAGEAPLYVPSVGSPEASLVCHTASASIPVRLVTLDDYFPPSVDVGLIKIDVEGGEYAVLRGAERLLRERRPVLLFESEGRHLGGGDVRDGFELLQRFGYQGSFFQRGELHPVSEFDPAKHQRSEGEKFWRSPDYVNNFLFTPC
jgi:FkbM family methyltransferase